MVDYRALGNGAYSIDGKEVRIVGNSIVTDRGRQRLDNGRMRVDSENSLFKAMYDISINDLEKLIIDSNGYEWGIAARKRTGSDRDCVRVPVKHFFWAGCNFNTLVYTRDTSYSSYFGAAYEFPEEVRDHIHFTMDLRKKLGMTVSKNHVFPIEGLEQNVCESEDDLMRRANTNSYTRRTDDVVWVLGYWEVAKVSGQKFDLEWMAETFDYMDKVFYSPFYDLEDGLYRGQPSFIDVGGNGYPGYSNAECALVKACSTNCLYKAAFDIMAKVHEELGNKEREEEFLGRSASLKKAINERFRGPDGRYMYFIDLEDRLSDRVELLGTAFAVLFDVAEDPSYIYEYPENDYGYPLIWPFYEGSETYHNRSSWPFSNMFMTLAKWKVSKDPAVYEDIFRQMARHVYNGDFNEVMYYETGEFIGGKGYIWSSAAMLALLYRITLGLDNEEYGTVSFSPYIHEGMGKDLYVDSLTQYGTKLDIEVHGTGSTVKEVTVDGKVVPDGRIECSGGERKVVITMAD